MKHYFLLFSIVFFCTFPLTAQIFTKLDYDNSKCELLEITKIELKEKYTILYCSLTPPKEYKHGWFCIEGEMKLINNDTNTKYSLIKLIGAPKCPNKFTTTRGTKPLKFRLYFEKIDDVSSIYSLIEDEKDISEKLFNIYNIEIR